MDSNARKFLDTQMQEFLAFSSPEMMFLVQSSSCSNKKSSNTKVKHLWDSSFSWKLFVTALCCHRLTGTTERLLVLCSIGSTQSHSTEIYGRFIKTNFSVAYLKGLPQGLFKSNLAPRSIWLLGEVCDICTQSQIASLQILSAKAYAII